MRKYPKDGCIEIKPSTIQWSEWRTRARSLPMTSGRTMESILRDCSAWRKQVDAWMDSLSEQQKHDLLQLAGAEIDMLYCLLDTPKDSPYYEDERLDFRTRFYELLPLVVTCEQLEVYGVERVRICLNGLERYATERHEWLP